ncbi:MAG TPA: hypothetical protein VFH03_00050, partial [Actinoplanes sp.]|nr:hypothetical protein [Actinoplanes sp.]
GAPPLPPATVSAVASVPGSPSGETTASLAAPAEPGPPGSSPAGVRPARRWMMVGAGIGLAAILVAGGVAYAQYGRGGDEDRAGGVPPPVASASASAAPSPTTPADELCTDEIKSNRRWVCLTSAVIADGKLTLAYDVEYAGSKPDVNRGYHVHFYGGDGKNPPDHLMGSHAPKNLRGKYFYDDRRPSTLSLSDDLFTTVIGKAPKVCARIAIAGHGLVPDNNNMYKTGNCWPITRS